MAFIFEKGMLLLCVSPRLACAAPWHKRRKLRRLGHGAPQAQIAQSGARVAPCHSPAHRVGDLRGYYCARRKSSGLKKQCFLRDGGARLRTAWAREC